MSGLHGLHGTDIIFEEIREKIDLIVRLLALNLLKD